jgi:hypothetical protein
VIKRAGEQQALANAPSSHNKKELKIETLKIKRGSFLKV